GAAPRRRQGGVGAAVRRSLSAWPPQGRPGAGVRHRDAVPRGFPIPGSPAAPAADEGGASPGGPPFSCLTPSLRRALVLPIARSAALEGGHREAVDPQSDLAAQEIVDEEEHADEEDEQHGEPRYQEELALIR